MTVTSSNCAALNAIPDCHRSAGIQSPSTARWCMCEAKQHGKMLRPHAAHDVLAGEPP
jgi:hypothetical protein